MKGRWAVARTLTLIWRGMRLERPGTDLIGAEDSDRSRTDREDQTCVSEKKQRVDRGEENNVAQKG